MANTTALRPEIRHYAEEAMVTMSKRYFVEVWRGVTRALHADPSYRVPVPFLLTHGEHDRTGNIARTAPAWAARETHCQYHVVPNAAHNANQDNPEFLNRVLLQFLEDCYPAGDA